MTTVQALQWVAVPGGVLPDGRLRLGVTVSPRLRTDEGDTLALFPDLLDWPATVAAATWSVEADGAGVPAEVVGDPPDRDLWAALFPPTTPVVPWRFPDLADRPVVTFDVVRVRDQVHRLYAAAAAASPDALPPVRARRDVEREVPAGLDDLLAEVVRPGRSRYGELERRLGVAGAADRLLRDARGQAAARKAAGVRGGPTLHPLPPGSVAEVERVALFHSSPETEPRAMPDGGEHYRAAVDVHQMLGSLAQHPALLRRLGLVVELALPAEAVPGPTGTITAAPALPAAGDAVIRESTAHRTAYRHEGERFVVARQTPHPSVPEGLLPLRSAGYTVNQLDVDGAALKTLATAVTVTTPPPSPTGPALHQPDTAGLAALRSTGLQVVQSGRADALQSEFGRALAVDGAVESGPATLFAEDLVRGYRLDVLDEATGVWRSLHERTTTTVVEGYPAGLPPEQGEGYLEVGLAERLTPPGHVPDPDGELYVHEALVSWDGWSLSAPRPGLPLSRHPDAPDPGRPETLPAAVPNDPETAMGLGFTDAVVPGSLPRLRFGRSYRLRLREVDLVGAGPDLTEADGLVADAPDGVLESGPYLRAEPVPAPALVPVRPYREGASLQRLVVRSDGGLDPVAWASGFDAAAEGHPGYDPVDVRHVAPPKAGFDLVEKHGLLDLAIGSDGTPPDADRVAVVTGAYEVARREKGTFDDPDAPGAQAVVVSGPDGAPTTRDVAHDVELLVLPYLPDPLATGAVLMGLPGVPDGEPYVVEFEPLDGTWWRAQPLRLALAGGGGPPEWDADARLLTVRLPQAATARVRVASLVPSVDLLAVWHWCEQELSGDDLDRVLTAMKENRCWLTTPWHELELVHAVQRPLQEPVWVELEASRPLEGTVVDLWGTVHVDGASTERVDIGAAWVEPVDDPRADGPRTVSARTTAFGLPLDASAVRDENAPAGYRLRDDHELVFDTRVSHEVAGERPPPHRLGDTRHRRIEYTVTATTRFREDFPVAWLDEPERLSLTSGRWVVDVPSTARPALPDLHHVVPTMGWSAGEEDGAFVSRRRGGGLRVWLGRGWWSSGDGELLGVLLGSEVVSPKGTDYPFISLIGQDLVRAGATLRNLRPASFRGDVVVATGVPLPGTPLSSVTVVGHAPRYDEETRRWYADISLDTGEAYAPFVRLALARYQPHSLPRRELSPLVLADIVQPLPDRTATVAADADDPSVRVVTVAGPSYTAVRGRGPATGADDSVLPAVTVTVQDAAAGVADDVLRWRDVPGTSVTLTRSVAGNVATWTGRVVLPGGHGGHAGDGRRLLVVEEERLYADGAAPGAEAVTSRVVYAVAVPV